VASGKSHAVESDRTVPWTPERIRLVFGPYAHEGAVPVSAAQ